MAELELRISDLDRDRAAAVLHQAVADGRLDWAEHSERLTAVFAARTASDLSPLLLDLQPPAPPGSARVGGIRTDTTSPPSAEPLQVMLSKVRRRPEPNTSQQVQVTLGAAVVDLRELPRNSVVEVVADTVLGKVEVYVSPGTQVIDSGTAWFGKRSTVEHGRGNRRAPIRPDAPMLRIGGHSVLGHVRVTIR